MAKGTAIREAVPFLYILSDCRKGKGVYHVQIAAHKNADCHAEGTLLAGAVLWISGQRGFPHH